MDSGLTLGFFQLQYLITLPIGMFLAFILLLIPSVLSAPGKADVAAKAVACVIMKTFALVLIGVSAFPLVYGVISATLTPSPIVSGLLMMFLFGVGLLAHYSRVLSSLDSAVTTVPRLVFSYVFELLGAIVAVMSVLTIVLDIIFTQTLGQWEVPATYLLLGLILMLTFSIHVGHQRRGMHAKVLGKKR